MTRTTRGAGPDLDDPGRDPGEAPPETAEFSGETFSIRVSSRRAGALVFVDEVGVVVPSDSELDALSEALIEAAAWRESRAEHGSQSHEGHEDGGPLFDVEPSRIWGAGPADGPEALTKPSKQNGGEKSAERRSTGVRRTPPKKRSSGASEGARRG